MKGNLRLVTRGFKQHYGIDFGEKFDLTVSSLCVRPSKKLYGLKQGLRSWHAHYMLCLKTLDFQGGTCSKYRGYVRR